MRRLLVFYPGSGSYFLEGLFRHEAIGGSALVAAVVAVNVASLARAMDAYTERPWARISHQDARRGLRQTE